MIGHIFTIIWNERRSNIWLLVEYIFVFCVLWFCCDYIYSLYHTYEAKPGFEITNVYMIKMGEGKYKDESDHDRYGLALSFLDRVKRHPEVEYVTIGTGMLYGWYSNGSMFINSDSLRYQVRKMKVTSDFFNVYDIPLTSGRVFDWLDDGDKNHGIISALTDANFGGEPGTPLLPISSVNRLVEPQREDDLVIDVIGTTGKVLDVYRGVYTSTVFLPIQREDIYLSRNQIAVRVKNGTGKDFPKRFQDEMKEPLAIGPYYLASVEPAKVHKDRLADSAGITGKMNGIFAITAFIIINIFIGILGTFWLRAQSRHQEIGLRMSMGATKLSVCNMMVLETVILLSLASLIGVTLCLTAFNQSLISTLDLPVIDRQAWRIGWKQDIINFVLTFSFLVIISIAAVLYPALKTINIQPIEALREN